MEIQSTRFPEQKLGPTSSSRFVELCQRKTILGLNSILRLLDYNTYKDDDRLRAM
jgi:hypothetical protein